MDYRWLWSLYHNKAKKILPSSFFILSFDCDTEEDIAVAWDVHQTLQEMGILPVYAVPGELLKKGADVYRKIHETGAEFINHGGRAHTYFDAKAQRHVSNFFYDQQPLTILREDILIGHDTLKNVLGITAQGWRTPHFGTFQKSEHLKFLYSTLLELNYTFSSSTSPVMAYRNGPIYKKNGIIEIPVSGVYSEPLNIIDTWAYFAAPDRVKNSSDYIQDTGNLITFAKNHPIVINIYGDPSHIYNKKIFFEAMLLLSETAKNINFSQLLKSYI